MTTDWKALCAELHAAFNTYAVDEVHHALLERARAALAQPEPPSLKERALETLKYPKDLWSEAEVDTIRRALEALPE